MEEIKTILGWEIKTCSLSIALTIDKYTVWHEDIKIMIENTMTSTKVVSQIEGQLNHVGFIIPLMKNFLNHIRKWKDRAVRQNWGKIWMSSSVRKDLALCLTFLNQAKAGISLNLIVFHKLTHLYRSDSIEH